MRKCKHMGGALSLCIDPDYRTTRIIVKGLISKPIPGDGRTSGDRQFYYINGRPFEGKVNSSSTFRVDAKLKIVQSLAKAFNEIYKSFLSNHYPSVVADFQLPAGIWRCEESLYKQAELSLYRFLRCKRLAR